MALVLKDRVKETTTTTGTGTVTLAGASTGYQSFSVIGNANTTYYCIAGQGTNEWEVGVGTYTASGTTLSRDTILASSNSGSVVTFSAGTKDVFVVYPAGKSVNLDASNNATALGTVASATLTNATGLPISTGVSGLGTGVATALAVNTGSSGAFVVNGGALGTPSSGTVTNLTGTASININGTVGATTPNTGAFTTLTTSSTVTLNGGTANGVAYLNGSKVLTTGSALTFDGTNFTYQSAISLINNDGSGNKALVTPFAYGGSGATGTLVLSSTYGNANQQRIRVGVGGAAAISFDIDSAEGARLTSTGLGIGTSSPSSKLEVYDATSAVARVTAGTEIFEIRNTGSEVRLAVVSADPMTFRTSNVEAMRIDSSGNVGIGTSSPSVKLEVNRGSAGSIATFTDGVSTNFNFSTSGTVGTFGTDAGSTSLALKTTGTERLRIDSSGNVGIGTSSPGYKLEVNGNASTSTSGIVRSGNGIFVNAQAVSTNYTIAATDNGLSAGPVTVNSGITVTISSGAVWTVV